MLFDENDEPHLKAWIIGRLANNSDADADVLADYVLALLRHDDTAENIRKMFDDEIPDFLSKGGVSFTDDVFQAIRYKSYLPGAQPPSVLPPQGHHPQLPQRPDVQFQPQPPQPSFPHPSAFPPSGPSNSRKRPYSDRDDDVHIILESPNPFNAPQPYKQARRGARDFAPRGGRYDSGYGMRPQYGARDSYQTSTAAPGGQFGLPPSAYPPYPPAQESIPPIDPNSIIENIQRLQQMGIPIPQTSELPRPVYSGTTMLPPRRRKGRCRDYDTKGYCARGNQCMYEHGPESVYMPTPSSFGPSLSDEYDPNNASLSLGPFGLPPPQPQGMPPQAMPPLPMAAPGRQDNRKQKRLPKGRPSVAANGPVHDKTKSTIVIQNIPAENFIDADIRGYFSQFGNIIDLTMQDDTRIAIVKFDSWESANAAWSSPKVIFDNRFVKVFWYKEEGESNQKGKPANGTKNGATNGNHSSEGSKEPEFDMEEFLRKQEDAQKIHEEKTQKRQEIEKERQELEERQKELVARQQEEKRKLQAKLAAKNGNHTAPSPSDSKPSTQAEALRAQLAALQEEANSLGIDPSDGQDESSSWAPRGRGRGTRGYRGQGSFPPRAHRGSYGYRGRGGTENRHAAYAAYSLDLRPKIIAITGADFTAPEKEEALRQYLFGTGEFSDIHIDHATTRITFKDRKTGEQFMFGVTAAGKNQIPGVEEKLELSWVNSAPTKTPATAGEAATADGGDRDGDALMASGLEDAAKAKADLADNNAATGAVNLEEGEVDQGDMDYEGIY